MDNFVITSLNIGEHSRTADFEKTSEWHKLLELTHAVWRVADVAIENEFLKSNIKQVSAEILSEYPNAIGSKKKTEDLLSHIHSQRALLSLAQKTSTSRDLNFTVLKNEYHKFSEAVIKLIPTVSEQRNETLQKRESSVNEQREERAQASTVKQNERTPSNTREARSSGQAEQLTDRQKKIFQFFSKRKGEKIRLNEIAKVFPDLTDRTVRNDLRELCIKKLVVRSDGHGQASFYKLGSKGEEM